MATDVLHSRPLLPAPRSVDTGAELEHADALILTPRTQEDKERELHIPLHWSCSNFSKDDFYEDIYTAADETLTLARNMCQGFLQYDDGGVWRWGTLNDEFPGKGPEDYLVKLYIANFCNTIMDALHSDDGTRVSQVYSRELIEDTLESIATKLKASKARRRSHEDDWNTDDDSVDFDSPSDSQDAAASKPLFETFASNSRSTRRPQMRERHLLPDTPPPQRTRSTSKRRKQVRKQEDNRQLDSVVIQPPVPARGIKKDVPMITVRISNPVSMSGVTDDASKTTEQWQRELSNQRQQATQKYKNLELEKGALEARLEELIRTTGSTEQKVKLLDDNVLQKPEILKLVKEHEIDGIVGIKDGLPVKLDLTKSVIGQLEKKIEDERALAEAARHRASELEQKLLNQAEQTDSQALKRVAEVENVLSSASAWGSGIGSIFRGLDLPTDDGTFVLALKTKDGSITDPSKKVAELSSKLDELKSAKVKVHSLEEELRKKSDAFIGLEQKVQEDEKKGVDNGTTFMELFGDQGEKIQLESGCKLDVRVHQPEHGAKPNVIFDSFEALKRELQTFRALKQKPDTLDSIGLAEIIGLKETENTPKIGLFRFSGGTVMKLPQQDINAIKEQSLKVKRGFEEKIQELQIQSEKRATELRQQEEELQAVRASYDETSRLAGSLQSKLELATQDNLSMKAIADKFKKTSACVKAFAEKKGSMIIQDVESLRSLVGDHDMGSAIEHPLELDERTGALTWKEAGIHDVLTRTHTALTRLQGESTRAGRIIDAVDNAADVSSILQVQGHDSIRLVCKKLDGTVEPINDDEVSQTLKYIRDSAKAFSETVETSKTQCNVKPILMHNKMFQTDEQKVEEGLRLISACAYGSFIPTDLIQKRNINGHELRIIPHLEEPQEKAVTLNVRTIAAETFDLIDRMKRSHESDVEASRQLQRVNGEIISRIQRLEQAKKAADSDVASFWEITQELKRDIDNSDLRVFGKIDTKSGADDVKPGVTLKKASVAYQALNGIRLKLNLTDPNVDAVEAVENMVKQLRNTEEDIKTLVSTVSGKGFTATSCADVATLISGGKIQTPKEFEECDFVLADKLRSVFKIQERQIKVKDVNATLQKYIAPIETKLGRLSKLEERLQSLTGCAPDNPDFARKANDMFASLSKFKSGHETNESNEPPLKIQDLFERIEDEKKQYLDQLKSVSRKLKPLLVSSGVTGHARDLTFDQAMQAAERAVTLATERDDAVAELTEIKEHDSKLVASLKDLVGTTGLGHIATIEEFERRAKDLLKKRTLHDCVTALDELERVNIRARKGSTAKVTLNERVKMIRDSIEGLEKIETLFPEEQENEDVKDRLYRIEQRIREKLNTPAVETRMLRLLDSNPAIFGVKPKEGWSPPKIEDAVKRPLGELAKLKERLQRINTILSIRDEDAHGDNVEQIIQKQKLWTDTITSFDDDFKTLASRFQATDPRRKLLHRGTQQFLQDILQAVNLSPPEWMLEVVRHADPNREKVEEERARAHMLDENLRQAVHNIQEKTKDHTKSVPKTVEAIPSWMEERVSHYFDELATAALTIHDLQKNQVQAALETRDMQDQHAFETLQKELQRLGESNSSLVHEKTRLEGVCAQYATAIQEIREAVHERDTKISSLYQELSTAQSFVKEYEKRHRRENDDGSNRLPGTAPVGSTDSAFVDPDDGASGSESDSASRVRSRTEASLHVPPPPPLPSFDHSKFEIVPDFVVGKGRFRFSMPTYQSASDDALYQRMKYSALATSLNSESVPFICHMISIMYRWVLDQQNYANVQLLSSKCDQLSQALQSEGLKHTSHICDHTDNLSLSVKDMTKILLDGSRFPAAAHDYLFVDVDDLSSVISVLQTLNKSGDITESGMRIHLYPISMKENPQLVTSMLSDKELQDIERLGGDLHLTLFKPSDLPSIKLIAYWHLMLSFNPRADDLVDMPLRDIGTYIDKIGQTLINITHNDKADKHMELSQAITIPSEDSIDADSSYIRGTKQNMGRLIPHTTSTMFRSSTADTMFGDSASTHNSEVSSFTFGQNPSHTLSDTVTAMEITPPTDLWRFTTTKFGDERLFSRERNRRVRPTAATPTPQLRRSMTSTRRGHAKTAGRRTAGR